MMSLEDYKKSKTIEGLIQKLFESRQVAHNAHLKSKSYSQHKALQKYYDEVLIFVDDLVETYQGQYGLLSNYEKLSIENPTSIEDYMEDAVKIFSAAREIISKKDTHLANILDEIIGLTYKTIYKLKYLK
jgi:hypothetical protein